MVQPRVSIRLIELWEGGDRLLVPLDSNHPQWILSCGCDCLFIILACGFGFRLAKSLFFICLDTMKFSAVLPLAALLVSTEAAVHR